MDYSGFSTLKELLTFLRAKRVKALLSNKEFGKCDDVSIREDGKKVETDDLPNNLKNVRET